MVGDRGQVLQVQGGAITRTHSLLLVLHSCWTVVVCGTKLWVVYHIRGRSGASNVCFHDNMLPLEPFPLTNDEICLGACSPGNISLIRCSEISFLNPVKGHRCNYSLSQICRGISQHRGKWCMHYTLVLYTCEVSTIDIRESTIVQMILHSPSFTHSGKSSVGKSCLLLRFTTGQFIAKTVTTLPGIWVLWNHIIMLNHILLC